MRGSNEVSSNANASQLRSLLLFLLLLFFHETFNSFLTFSPTRLFAQQLQLDLIRLQQLLSQVSHHQILIHHQRLGGQFRRPPGNGQYLLHEALARQDLRDETGRFQFFRRESLPCQNERGCLLSPHDPRKGQ